MDVLNKLAWLDDTIYQIKARVTCKGERCVHKLRMAVNDQWPHKLLDEPMLVHHPYVTLFEKPSHMKIIKRFEDLRCWQASRQLVKLIFVASNSGLLAKDFDTRSQLKRAALSCMNNLAEGFGRFGVKDSIKFYDVSQSSALEVKSMMYLLLDLEYLTEQQITEIRQKTEETRNLTLAFIKYQRRKLKKKTNKDNSCDN